METGFVVVCYDIPDTKVRNRLVHVLFACGLSRIQYSVFSGVIPITRISRMTRQIQQEFLGNADKILIMPMCRSCVSRLTAVHVNLETEPRSFLVI